VTVLEVQLFALPLDMSGFASDVPSIEAGGEPQMTHPSVLVADVYGIVRGVVEDGVVLAWSAEDAAQLRASMGLGVERAHSERSEET